MDTLVGIEGLSEQDVRHVALQFRRAEEKIYEACGERLSNHRNDLSLIQDLLHVNTGAELSPTLWETLGVVVGMVFTSEQYDADWCAYVTNEGRKVCICDHKKTVLFHPEGLFHASRFDIPDVKYVYETLVLQSIS